MPAANAFRTVLEVLPMVFPLLRSCHTRMRSWILLEFRTPLRGVYTVHGCVSKWMRLGLNAICWRVENTLIPIPKHIRTSPTVQTRPSECKEVNFNRIGCTRFRFLASAPSLWVCSVFIGRVMHSSESQTRDDTKTFAFFHSIECQASRTSMNGHDVYTHNTFNGNVVGAPAAGYGSIANVHIALTLILGVLCDPNAVCVCLHCWPSDGETFKTQRRRLWLDSFETQSNTSRRWSH